MTRNGQENKKNLFSVTIKNGRKQKGYSQKQLGELTGISHQIISRYEKGQEIPTEEKLNTILTVLDINHEDLIVASKEIDIMFDKYINDQFYREMNDDYYKALLDKNRDSYQLCHNYYKVLIIDMINSIFVNEDYIIEEYIIRIDSIKINDNKALQIFYEYKGFYSLTKRKTQKGLELLEKAKTLYYDEKVIAMIHYHMCFAHNYECLRKYDFDIINEASKIFIKYNSYRRMSDCELIKGNFYEVKRNYSKAIESYESCFRIMKMIQDSELDFSIIYRNLSYVYMRIKEYDKALEELEKERRVESNDIRMHLHYIWCYYKKQDIMNANHWIVKMKRLNLDKEQKMLWQLYDQLVHQYDKTPNDKLMNQAIKVYDYYVNEDDLDMMLFYVDVVIELLERKEDYKTAFFYQKEKINLLESI